MKKTKLEVTRVYNNQEKLEDLLLQIVEDELESQFEELYNKTQAGAVINQERLVA